MTAPQDGPPKLVDQDEMPYGIWRADQDSPVHGYMEWEYGPENPTGEMRRLYDQAHESGSWWAGSGQSMTWMANEPAPAPDPNVNAGESSNG